MASVIEGLTQAAESLSEDLSINRSCILFFSCWGECSNSTTTLSLSARACAKEITLATDLHDSLDQLLL